MTPAAQQIDILAETFRLLGDPTRLRILYSCAEGPLAVGEITERLGLSQTLVSHHLRLLRGARLVRRERKGRQMFYDLADAHIRTLLRDMAEHIDEDEE